MYWSVSAQAHFDYKVTKIFWDFGYCWQS